MSMNKKDFVFSRYLGHKIKIDGCIDNQNRLLILYSKSMNFDEKRRMCFCAHIKLDLQQNVIIESRIICPIVLIYFAPHMMVQRDNGLLPPVRGKVPNM